MIAPVFYVLTFISVSTQATPIGHGTAVNIDVTKQYHDDVIPNAFNIKCIPLTYENDAKAILSIQLAKDDKNIANLQSGDSIFYNRFVESRVTAEGHLDGVINKSYLSVTINGAKKKDSGSYTCKLIYIDENLSYKYATASSNVTITNQDTEGIIKYLMSKISLLEDELSNVKTSLSDQGTRLRDLNTTIVDQGTKTTSLDQGPGPQDHGTQFSHDLSNVKTTLEQQGARLQSHEIEINKTLNPTIFFTAWHTGTGNFKKGVAIVYNDVHENVGGAYNGSTGKFTAPIDGLYFFDVSVCSLPKTGIYIELKASDGRVLTRLFDYDGDSYSYSDTSCVTKLLAGESVRPVTAGLVGGYILNTREKKDSFNKFFGFLVKAL